MTDDMTTETLFETLDRKREGYADELAWHRFLLDAYAGTGGFQGKVRQPFASWWGAAADMYAGPSALRSVGAGSDSAIETYLDRYQREDVPKFGARAAASCYENLVETIVDIRLSYMGRKQFMRGLEKAADVETWLTDVDGASTWDEMRRDVIDVRAAVLGWCPVLVDVDAMPSGVGTRAQAEGANVRTSPRAIPLFPAHLFDWACDAGGAFVWVKTGVEWVERVDVFAPTTAVRRFTVWGREGATWWEFSRTADGKPGSEKWQLRGTGETKYEGQAVPLVVFRHKPVPQDHVRGLSMIGSAANLNRRLFNSQSELDEHMRACAFGILQVPMRREAGSKQGEVVIGAGNALPIDPDWKNEYKWITPDSGVATTFENRIEALEKQICRVGRIEFTRATSGAATSGVSRSFEFDSTNRAIADFAAQLAKSEQIFFRIVARRMGQADTESITSTAPQKFDVEEMAKELEEAISAITGVKVGAKANAEIRKRIARKMLPNLDEATMAEIDDEIDDLGDEEAAMRAMSAEMLAAGAEDSNAEPDDDEMPAQAPGQKDLAEKPGKAAPPPPQKPGAVKPKK